MCLWAPRTCRPEAPNLWNSATDLATVHFGFGLFSANSAFNSQQFTDVHRQDWNVARSGYLSEREWSFAIALFGELCDVPPQTCKGFVKEAIWSQIANNRTDLRANPAVLARLRGDDE